MLMSIFFGLNITYLLIFILVLPLIGVFLLLFTPSSNHSALKTIALNISCLIYVASLLLWVFFNKSICSFQFTNKLL